MENYEHIDEPENTTNSTNLENVVSPDNSVNNQDPSVNPEERSNNTSSNTTDLNNNGSDSSEVRSITSNESNNNHIRSEYDRITTKEDIKYMIDKSKNSKELYENALKVLKNLERNFQDTLFEISADENWDAIKNDAIRDSSFNNKLNTDNPVTLFEIKGKELLKRAEELEDKIGIQNAASQSMGGGELDLQGIDLQEKNKLIDELFQTREDAIQNFKDDIADGFLSNENNISRGNLLAGGIFAGHEMFALKEEDPTLFKSRVDGMSLEQLAFVTFNIEEGSGAFTYCYGKLKEKLGNKNLLDFIDENNKPGNRSGEATKYSALKMLFQRRMSSDLSEMINGYSGNKQDIIQYVENNLDTDEEFKISFLTSARELENSQYFGNTIKDLKEKDINVKKAYEAAENINNIDIFKEGKIDGLMVYDNEGHGGGSEYFDSNFNYYKRKNFICDKSLDVDNADYTKHVLKKGKDTITMIKIKNLKRDNMQDSEVETVLNSIVDKEDYNFFALRGHCYNTEQVAGVLGKLNAVGEGDFLIDGGCNNSINTRDYYKSGMKGQICTYTSTGKGDSTQAFIDRIINTKNSGKQFSDVLGYYDGLTTDSGNDGYFAFSTERPNSVGAQYKRLEAIEVSTETADTGTAVEIADTGIAVETADIGRSETTTSENS